MRMVRLLRLLEWARPTDVATIASALPEAELAAAIEAMEGQLSPALREYILTEGSSALLIALARHAIAASDRNGANMVGRILTRFDPETDAAFFEREFSGDLQGRARYAILRTRKGPDGRAVIAPRVKQHLLSAIANVAADLAAEDGPAKLLLSELAYADDPDLIRALLPHASTLSAAEAARVILTLNAYGHRAEAKRHRGLWAGRGRSFTFLGIRRFSILPSVAGPEKPGFPGTRRVSEPGGLLEQQRTIQEALRAGTVSAAEILEQTRPAALTLSLAYCANPDSLRPDERRAMEDMRALLTQYAAEQLDGDTQRWIRAIRRVRNYEGSFPKLLADTALLADSESDVEKRGATDFAARLSQEIDTRNILISLAPRETANRLLAAERMKTMVTAMARAVPLSRPLVERILSHGSVTQRRRLAFNTDTPDAVLARLIEKTGHTDIMFWIMDRPAVGQEVLDRAYTAAPHNRQYKTWVDTWAPYTPDVVLNALRCKAYDPAWLLSVLQDTADSFDEPGRIAAYVLLADVAGVEAVWAVELNRAGSLEAMAACVRASMTAGDAKPLIEAAQASPIEDRKNVRPRRPSRTEEHLDHAPSPFWDLIRTRLDGHTDRWLELLELFRSRPYASDEELIAEFPGPGSPA